MKFTLKALTVAAAASISTMAFADEGSTSPHSISGNIGVLSSYDLRGLTNIPENDNATIQGGLDYEHESGFYAGWWGSTLGYSLEDKFDGQKAFEHDFYAGYNGSINEDFGYTLGLTYYYYYKSDFPTNALETLIGISYKDFGLTAQTLLKDTTWGNKGDTYYLGTYSFALPKDFSLDTALGLYSYKKSGKYIESSKESFNFRNFNVGLSKPLADTGVTASMNYIFGGYDRDEVKQKNKVVFGLAYNF